MEPRSTLGKPELVARLRQRIQDEGPLPFSTFMREALYAPDLGYYSRLPPIGPAGDFYTAVSAGPLLGRLLAWQTLETWERLNRPAPFLIIEQGAHRGDMLADLWREICRDQPALADTFKLILIEPDPARRIQQEGTLRTSSAQPTFLQDPSDLPTALSGCFYANELLDSFPCDRVCFLQGRWMELRVAWDHHTQGFHDAPAPLRSELAPLIESEQLLPLEGFTAELCLDLESWLPTLLSHFQTGHIILLDYALTRDERRSTARRSGTIRAYYQHRLGTDPFRRVGEQDITYHIHATRLIEIAQSLGWAACALDQYRAITGMIASFLPEGSPRLASLRPRDFRNLQTLVHPDFLGRAFTAFSLRKAWPEQAPPPAIETFATRHELRRH